MEGVGKKQRQNREHLPGKGTSGDGKGMLSEEKPRLTKKRLESVKQAN